MKYLLLLVGLLGGSWPNLVAARNDQRPTLLERRVYGNWRGQLDMPGGSAEVTIDVIEMPDGSRSAKLSIPLQRLNAVPLSVMAIGDSVRFTATRPALQFAGRWVTDEKLNGVWNRGGSITNLTLSRSASSALPAKTTPVSYLTEEVHFANTAATNGVVASASATNKDGLVLAGTFTKPAGKGPFPTVVLLSDHGPHNRNATYDGYSLFTELANHLNQAGFAVLRYDDRGVGGSTGDLASSSIVELATDAQAGLNFLRTRADVDVARLGLIGHGEGANVALVAAGGALPPSFVVALAGYGVPGHEALVQQQTMLLQNAGADAAQVEASTVRQRSMLAIIRNMTDKALTQSIVANMLSQDSPGMDPAIVQASAAQLLTRYYRTLLDFDPQAQLAQVQCPVLLLAGTADEQVHADTNLAALQKGLRNGRSVSVAKLPGVNHLLQPEYKAWPVVDGQAKAVAAPAALATLTSWLQRQKVK